MRIALVMTMELSPSLAPTFGRYADLFVELLQSTDPGVDLTIFDGFTENRKLPSSSELQQFDAVLIPGSPNCCLDELPWIIELEEFIREAAKCEVPLIGVCFGHQIIAKAFGGEIARNYESRYNIGVDTYFIEGRHSWIQPAAAWVTCSVTHRDQVVKLPKDAVLFARSERCKIAGFIIPNKAICVQSHPEMSRTLIHALLELRRSTLSTTDAIAAADSLQLPHQGDLLCRWILNWVEEQKNSRWIPWLPFRVSHPLPLITTAALAVGVAVAVYKFRARR